MVIDNTVLDTRVEKLTVVDNLSVRLLVLVRKNFSFDGIKPVCDINCYGKTIKEWAVSSAGEFACKVLEYGLSDNVIDIIKPHLANEKITIALFCETPLIRHSTLVDLVNDFIYKKQKIRKFKRGYLFDTEFVKQAESVYAPEIGQENGEDFMAITNTADLNNVLQIMKRRIMSYHISNGVQIVDINSTYIEAEVELQAGVIIYPNNNILGKTFIEKGVVLYPNNVIKDSYICEKAVLKGAFIESAKVQAKAVIEPFTKVMP
ncbi:MAG: hypothetical protein IJZ29_04110 [Clostridia bacterium]|nr:hypothetical protein [Clostridia bacterium]